MQLIIPAASAGLGYLAFGSTGAQIGWMLGSMMAAEQQTISTSKLGETFVATSAYGTPFAKIYGTERIPGNTFWSTEKVPHTTTSGGGKGASGPEVETTYYTVTRAVEICYGPILGIRAVYDNDKMVVGPGGNPLPGTLHLGGTSQMPDSVLQSHLGSTIPAWRGRAYMVMSDEYLGQGGVVPNYSFEVVFGEVII